MKIKDLIEFFVDISFIILGLLFYVAAIVFGVWIITLLLLFAFSLSKILGVLLVWVITAFVAGALVGKL